jgi:MinD-like ATPase involved in chromosome partitioning or flagellar assembly
MSGKGGVGKTTLVTNVSTILAKRKKSVVVLDGNITTSHLLMHFGKVYHPKTLNDVLKDEASIVDATYLNYTGVKIVPASLNLSDLVGVDISMLGSKVKKLFKGQDYVFVDTAPGFGKEAISGIMACNEAVLVATPYLPDISDIIRGKTILEDINIKISGLVLNKVTGKDFELSEKDIVELTELPILAKIPFDFRVLQSLGMKIPLTFYDKKSEVSREFFRVATAITGENYLPERTSVLDRLTRLFKKWS